MVYCHVIMIYAIDYELALLFGMQGTHRNNNFLFQILKLGRTYNRTPNQQLGWKVKVVMC